MDEEVRDDRPIRYVTDSGVVYRASGFGYCDRAFVGLAHGMTPVPAPAWLQQAFKEGIESEPLILAKYEEVTGKKIVKTQVEVDMSFIIDGKEVTLLGHVDAVNEDGVPVECKKVSANYWDDAVRRGVESNVLYPWQAAIYAWANDGELEFVQGCYKDGVISEIKVHRYEEPVIPLSAIYKRVHHLEGLINSGTHYMDVPCGPVIYPCGWHYLHDEDADEWPERKDMEPWLRGQVQMLGDWQAQRRELQRRVKELEVNIKGVDATLRVWLDANGEGGAEKSTVEFNGIEYQLTRTKFSRKEYVVPATTVDYITVATREDKAERNKARAAKAAATRAAKNRASKQDVPEE